MSPPDPYQPPRPVETPTRTGLSIVALVILLAAILGPLLGCATAPDVKRLCVAADTAGRALTVSGQVLRTIHDVDVETHWATECDHLPEIPARVVCRHRVVDELAGQYRARYAAAEQAAAAQHALADALEAIKVCKETP